ncbi:hypothetical protein ER13_09505 [Brevundimonas sp. EAKA]|nr:hypothetical protein ER13_09505 [Brevundimonas sp. EAKA]
MVSSPVMEAEAVVARADAMEGMREDSPSAAPPARRPRRDAWGRSDTKVGIALFQLGDAVRPRP